MTEQKKKRKKEKQQQQQQTVSLGLAAVPLVPGTFQGDNHPIPIGDLNRPVKWVLQICSTSCISDA